MKIKLIATIVIILITISVLLFSAYRNELAFVNNLERLNDFTITNSLVGKIKNYEYQNGHLPLSLIEIDSNYISDDESNRLNPNLVKDGIDPFSDENGLLSYIPILTEVESSEPIGFLLLSSAVDGKVNFKGDYLLEKELDSFESIFYNDYNGRLNYLNFNNYTVFFKDFLIGKKDLIIFGSDNTSH